MMRLSVLSWVLLCAGIAGCGGDLFHQSNGLPAQDPILSDGVGRPQTPYAGPSLYCYKTLADVDCHGAPLPNSANRLVEKYDGPERTDPIKVDIITPQDSGLD